jgi:hypothetical protein
MWLGLFAIVVFVFTGVIGELDNSLQYSILTNIGVLIGGYFLYLGARSLVPLNKISPGPRIPRSLVGAALLMIVLGSALGVVAASPSTFGTPKTDAPSSSTLYFTQIGAGVGSVAFNYDPTNHTLKLGTIRTVVPSIPGGGDGLVFDPFTGDLIVGVNGGGPAKLTVVDPVKGQIIGDITTDR